MRLGIISLELMSICYFRLIFFGRNCSTSDMLVDFASVTYSQNFKKAL